MFRTISLNIHQFISFHLDWDDDILSWWFWIGFADRMNIMGFLIIHQYAHLIKEPIFESLNSNYHKFLLQWTIPMEFSIFLNWLVSNISIENRTKRIIFIKILYILVHGFRKGKAAQRFDLILGFLYIAGNLIWLLFRNKILKYLGTISRINSTKLKALEMIAP